MKRSKSKSKYAPTFENAKPICPICGKHTIETEIDELKVRDGDDIFTVKSPFFRCYRDGECYQTDEMKSFENSQLRAHMLKKEIDKRNNITNKVKIPSLVKESLNNDINTGYNRVEIPNNLKEDI